MQRLMSFVLVVAVAVTLASGCGGSSQIPTSPAASTSSSSGTSNPPPSGGATVTVAGFVPGAIPPTGTCPAIRFGVESKATGAYIDTVAVADSATQFSGGSCTDVVLGVLLEVQGDQQADKSIHALVVKFTPKGAPVRQPR